MLTISTASLEYVLVPVSRKVDGAYTSPTGDTVKMAFVATDAAPSAGDLKSADWETDATTTPATYYARCLVGTGGTVALAAGIYNVWVKVTDNPEAPVKRAGRLTVT